MIRALMIVTLLTIHTAAAAAENEAPTFAPLTNPMEADISQNAVEIRTSFNGGQLLIFGARNLPGEMVIVVRGPARDVVMRRKEKIAGMWMHVEEARYEHLPLFYAVASSAPLERITTPDIHTQLTLGHDAVTAASHNAPHNMFDDALFESLAHRQWWQVPFSPITFFGESLFKAKLTLPDSLPGGIYTAEIYLFDEGKLLAAQTIPVQVAKTGLEARLVANASEHSLWYGLTAISMALAGGWLAHRLFHRA